MLSASCPKRTYAIQMLVLATLFWGLSFPVMKALFLAQQQLSPNSNTVTLTALTLSFRFGISAAVLFLWHFRSFGSLTSGELWQGLGLGFFGGGGLLLQMDGLAYTAASTSAFLTQFYCIIIPFWVAIQRRRWPSLASLLCCFMVLGGMAILSKLDVHTLGLGRGEIETLLSSIMFTGQILWLEKPCYAANRMGHTSAIMFAVMALCGVPVMGLTAGHVGELGQALSSIAVLAMLSGLIIICTLGGYLLMNYWQPCVTSTEAGLIYCMEPLFASIYAWFMPGWLSLLAGVNYANESLTLNLAAGGALITIANLLLQTQSRPVEKTGP